MVAPRGYPERFPGEHVPRRRSDGTDKRLVTEAATYYLEGFDWQPRP